MRITSLGYRPINNQSGQNHKSNSTPQFQGKIVIKNAEGSVLEHLIEKTQQLLRLYNRNAASNAKLDYFRMWGEKIEFDAETPFKIIREGNALTFSNRLDTLPYMYSHPGYDAVAKKTADILNKALFADAKRKGLDPTTVPQLEFTLNNMQDKHISPPTKFSC